MVVFSEEDHILIKNLYKLKSYCAKRLIKEFPTKGWKLRALNKLLGKLKDTGTTDRRPGSGRPNSACTASNINTVNDLVLSQEDAPRSHRTTRQIRRKTGISQTSVMPIIHNDLQLKCLKKRRVQELTAVNRLARLSRTKQVLQKFSPAEVDFIFFTDEKVFTVAPPVNRQNDRVYAPITVKKRDVTAERLLRTRSTLSKSVVVSVAVSKLGCSGLIFVESGVKVNGAYYRDVLLQKMLPAIRSVAGEPFIFQQYSAPAHRAHEKVSLLERETPRFIGFNLWPQNSPDLNPVDYKVQGVMQECVYKLQIKDVSKLKQRLIEAWSAMQECVIDKAIDKWRKRLRFCVSAKGGHFEHKL